MNELVAVKDPFLSEMLRGNAEVLSRAHELHTSISDEDLERSSASGGWTVGQLFEHLIVSGRLYTDKLDALMDRARTQRRVGTVEWKPSLVGGAILRGVHPRNVKRHRTFAVFEPGPEPRPHVIREFIRMHETLDDQLRKADGLNLKKVRLSSPVSSLLRLNLGDAFGILVFHSQRHLNQIARILEERAA